MRRNPATIIWPSFLPTQSQFQWVAVLAIGLVRKGAVDDSRLLVFLQIFHIFNPHGVDSASLMYRTYIQTDRMI